MQFCIYHNLKGEDMIITLTGKPCSGKGTLARVLKDKYNFRVYSVGEIFKEEAKKRGLSSEEFNKLLLSDPKYDNLLDKRTVELGKKWKNENVVFDSRLAWHFIPHSFKVFLDLDEDEMAKRLVNSDREGKEKCTDIEEAKRTVIERFNAENVRYQKFYGIDNLDMSNYDLVLSSKNKTPEELAEIVYNAYKKHFKIK